MNIIFLDIDGVLNNDETYILKRNLIDTTNISLFLQAVTYIKKQKQKIKIVISSSWRNPNLEGFIRYIYDVCGKSNNKYVDKLINNLHPDYCTKHLSGFNKKRGHEVKEWLSRHPEVKKYLCIDDESDFLTNQPLLQTFPQIGFRLVDMALVKKYFIKEQINNTDFIINEELYSKRRINNRLKFINTYITQ